MAYIYYLMLLNTLYIDPPTASVLDELSAMSALNDSSARIRHSGRPTNAS